jgi:GNAT superfamily N-acetyltransferase
MGAKPSKPGSSRRIELTQTRKRVSPPKHESPKNATRRNDHRNGLRIRIPKRSSDGTRSSSEPRALYFDHTLPPWRKIHRDFEEDQEAKYFVYMFYDPTDYWASVEDDDYLIPSGIVMRWADKHFDKLISFCSGEISAESALRRYRDGDEEPEAYGPALLLAIQRSGRILGFATVEGWDSKTPTLMDICVDKKGRGVGSDIIETFMTYAQARGARDLDLSAVKSAVPFYQRLGFTFKSRDFEEDYNRKQPIYSEYGMRILLKDYFREEDA